MSADAQDAGEPVAAPLDDDDADFARDRLSIVEDLEALTQCPSHRSLRDHLRAMMRRLGFTPRAGFPYDLDGPDSVLPAAPQDAGAAAEMRGDFYQSFDARDWAAAFVERARKDASFATDEGNMIGWFANALMRGYDEHAQHFPPVLPTPEQSETPK